MGNRIISIELFRFICMSIIVIWHTHGQIWFSHGYLPVDFFFLVSGVFIYYSGNKTKQPALSPYLFTLKKIRKFFPKYIIALFFAFCVIILFRNYHYGNDLVSGDDLFKVLTEFFMLQELGPFPRGINGPAWYISVLVIGGGHFIFFFILFKTIFKVLRTLPYPIWLYMVGERDKRQSRCI